MFRIGLGHDSHRLGPGDGLVIGGVSIPHHRAAIGHSDADVLLHAITDALLGAAALGDIGEMFPDTDPANQGRDSADMLRRALDRVSAAGWRIEPPVSVPIASGASKDARAADDPPPDPPGMRSRSHGFRVGPNAECSVDEPIANSSMFVLPRITMSASRSRCTTVAS